MGNVTPAVVSVIGGIIGLAIIAVLVSQQAQTGTVLSSAGSALSSVIGAAVQPVTGAAGNTFGAAANSALGAVA